VSAIKEVMLNHSAKEHLKMLKKYQAKIPDPLNRQFDDRVSKAEAICLKYERNKLKTELFPAGKCNTGILIINISITNNRLKIIILFYLVNKQTELQSQLIIQQNNTQEGPPAKKKAPCCRKCHQPIKGHPRNKCP
jgi:hypothetical protein